MMGSTSSRNFVQRTLVWAVLPVRLEIASLLRCFLNFSGRLIHQSRRLDVKGCDGEFRVPTASVRSGADLVKPCGLVSEGCVSALHCLPALHTFLRTGWPKFDIPAQDILIDFQDPLGQV